MPRCLGVIGRGGGVGAARSSRAMGGSGAGSSSGGGGGAGRAWAALGAGAVLASFGRIVRIAFCTWFGLSGGPNTINPTFAPSSSSVITALGEPDRWRRRARYRC